MFRIRLLCLGLAFASCKNEPTESTRDNWTDVPAYWVWNQTTPPPSNSEQLYLQVAEFTQDSVKILQNDLPTSRCTAVIRLPPGRSTLEDPQQKQRLLSYLDEISPRRLQLDYDCAASDLALYRRLLESIRSRLDPEFLSITALASWISVPEFHELARSVDEVTPMFYDLEADQAAEILANSPCPLVDSTTLSWIERWQHCPVSWRAGLPNYQRLSLFDSSGNLIGHLQQWSPSELGQLPGLSPLSEEHDSVTFLVKQSQVYRGVNLARNHLLVWRCPDEDQTALAISAARMAGASGLIWFAHPDSSPVAWHSLPHLATITSGREPKPDLNVTFNSDGSVTLNNTGDGDFFSPPVQPHGELVLETKSPGSFARLEPGSFEKISSPGGSLVRPHLVQKLSLSFSQLRASQSISTAPNLLANPGAPPPKTSISASPPR